jgi:hypothetical protein
MISEVAREFRENLPPRSIRLRSSRESATSDPYPFAIWLTDGRTGASTCLRHDAPAGGPSSAPSATSHSTALAELPAMALASSGLVQPSPMSTMARVNSGTGSVTSW